MKHAESVTFGGSGLNRAAELRCDAKAMAHLAKDKTATMLPLWRGKPLFAGEGRDRLGWLPMDHKTFAEATEAPIFLGLDETGPRFAQDISAWEPAEVDEAGIGAFFDPSEQYHPALPADHRFAELRGVMTRLTPRDAELAVTGKALIAWHRAHGFCAKCGAKSEIILAGWQRECPICKTHHFPRTDPVVIMLILHGNRVLMGRSPGWPEGMYSLLAGFVEPGETLEAAVRREVFEETRIRVGPVSYLASQPWPYPASLMIGCRGEAISDAITVDAEEIEDARWLTREEMLAIYAGQNQLIKPSRPGSIAHFLIKNWLADRLV